MDQRVSEGEGADIIDEESAALRITLMMSGASNSIFFVFRGFFCLG